MILIRKQRSSIDYKPVRQVLSLSILRLVTQEENGHRYGIHDRLSAWDLYDNNNDGIGACKRHLLPVRSSETSLEASLKWAKALTFMGFTDHIHISGTSDNISQGPASIVIDIHHDSSCLISEPLEPLRSGSLSWTDFLAWIQPSLWLAL